IPAEKLIRIHKEGGADSSQALETLAVLAEDDEITSQTAPSAFYVGSYCLHLFSKDRSAVHLARLALKYLEKAAQNGHPQAAALLAECLDRGTCGETDPQKALFWYEKAARAKDPHAMGEYGRLLAAQARKRLREADAEPMPYFQRSGREEACRLYREGMDWLEKGAAAGSVEAMYQQGWQHQLGFMPLQAGSDADALTWYRKAVEKGHGGAMRRIGDLCHYGGGGLAKDPHAALDWYIKATQAGHAPAFSSAGDLYSVTFRELPNHNALALEWYRKGAEAGDSTSMLRLGDRCLNGLRGLVEKDPAAAEKWFLKAADAGSFAAPGRLAALYLAGEGVEQSNEKAIFWYKKALENGDPSAVGHLKKLGVDP
ncbi:MAG: SEL1-like repeat protein, partial [Oscillospiraceae bacterium]|nr:SEL1-like repeat protein [Oscillospiraceae bacterium]